MLPPLSVGEWGERLCLGWERLCLGRVEQRAGARPPARLQGAAGRQTFVRRGEPLPPRRPFGSARRAARRYGRGTAVAGGKLGAEA